MDLRQLRYFVAIVDHGSLTRASETLRIAQPALSQHLKRLEEELETPLLLRTARGIVPTESGERLAEKARDLLRQADAIGEAIRGIEMTPTGPVTIGIPTSLGMMLSIPLALAVRQDLPQVRLRVVEGLSGHTLEWLQGGQVDLALIFGAAGIAGLSMTEVASESLHLVAPAGDPKLDALRDASSCVTFQSLRGLPLILPGHPHGVREEVERAARDQGISLDVVLEMDALDHIKALVAAGAGYTILSKRVATSGIGRDTVETAPIEGPKIVRTIHLAHSSNRPLSAAARAVHRLIADQLAALTENGRWKTP